MTALDARPLTTDTWPAFARLVEANNGVWGGCWCIGFHPEGLDEETRGVNRRNKEKRVRAGTTHSALVFEGDDCVGWCQYGSPAELPRIKRKKEYEKGISKEATDEPDWRITCFYTGKGHRGKGVAAAALDGALAQMRALGGGVVEAYPEDTAGRKTSGSFLHGGTLEMFERAGFEKGRQIGKHHFVVRRRLRRSRSAGAISS